MTRPLAIVFAVALLAAGCDGNGPQEAGPVPTVPASGATSTAQESDGTTTEATPSTFTSSTPALALCSDRAARVTVSSQEGAAGTIRTVWRVKNTADHACRTFGYPGMDFHAASGWLNVRVHRGGFSDVNEAPARVVLAPGQSLHFVSYWSDVTTNSGPCNEFDRVKVTLPDNFVSAGATASGCLNPESVDVGPVTK
jgi:hypothetical protein